MRVECEVEEADLENEDGHEQEGLCVTCGRCHHEEEVYGRSDASVRRALATLRANCPEGESNYYVVEGTED